jgi:hypothetical protein
MPELSFPSGPPNTAAAAAPTNARYACEYLTAAIDQLASDDQSVNGAVASVQSSVDSALAASANDPAYTRLTTDAKAFLVDVVRQQLQLQISGRVIEASKYPASYRDAVKAVEADCS